MAPDPLSMSEQLTEPDGRAANAWRHGMAARRLTVADEDAAEFDALRSALVEQWRPRNVTAFMLVDHLARCQWRLMRAGEAEIRLVEIVQTHTRVWDGSVSERRHALPATHAVANDLSGERSGLARMQMFQGRLERSIHRTIHLLRAMRKSRGKRGKPGRTAAG